MTLDDVVDDYIKRFQAKFDTPSDRHSAGHDDPIVDYCKAANFMPEVIKRAVHGRRPDGRLFKKGSCVRTSSKHEMIENLLMDKQALQRCTDFEQLHQRVKSSAPWGIGPMTVYAVTERIGAWKGIKPEAYLYLHAGPAQGWKRLTGKRAPEKVPAAQLPQALHRIELYHVENLLCEYHEALHPGML